MGLFGKSEEEIRIEIIQREVRIINPLIMSLLTIEVSIIAKVILQKSVI